MRTSCRPSKKRQLSGNQTHMPMKSKKAKDGFDTDGILLSYKKEVAAFDHRGLKFPFCPASCLLCCACTGCPVEDKCVRGNPGSIFGIDHQTISKNKRGEKCFAFRPYREAFYDERREMLKAHCDFFKLELEILDTVTYAEGTLTVSITPGPDSLQFRGGKNFARRPWYGKGSPYARYREAMRK